MRSCGVIFCDYEDKRHQNAVVELLNAYISDDMGGGVVLDKKKQSLLLKGLKTHQKSIVFLALVEGEFVGLLIAFENFSTFAAQPMINIHDVIVLKDFRKLGVGRALMNAILSEAKKRGCSRVSLEVREDNIAAKNLYKSLGFDAACPNMLYWRKEI
jgi:ribosomal protein S18 acetylase RimI-like enzyme